jgi:hypothetical protein
MSSTTTTTTSMTATINSGHVLVADGREGSELVLYLAPMRDAPGHMKRNLARTGEREFNDILEDGPDSLNGLVNEDSERAEEHAEAVWEWINSCTVPENRFKPSDARVRITHTITIVCA